MTKRRSRITMGPGGVVYVVITALILGAAIYTQANLLFWSFGLMVGGLLVSFFMALQMLRGVGVQRLMPSHGVAGDALILRYHLTNRSWMPAFGVVISETWGPRSWFRRAGWKRVGPIAQQPQRLRGLPFGWVLHLGSHAVVQAEAPCWPLRRGMLRFERMVISTSFPFGVVRKVVEFTQPGEVLIYPHLYRINRRMLFRLSQIDPSGRKQLERAGGTEEFFGLREHRLGDSLRMIDWKHSARADKLITREMTQPSPPRIMLALDLRETAQTPMAAPRNGRKRRRKAATTADRIDSTEQAISLAASLVCDAHFHGYQIGMVVWGARATAFPIHHSLPHRDRMLETLATLDPRIDGRGSEVPIDPSVIVRRGPSGPESRRGGLSILGTDDMQRYISEASGGGAALLARRAAPRSRRQELQDVPAGAQTR